MGEWRDIATAPRDGTPIILARAGGGWWPRSGWWSQTFSQWVVRENDEGATSLLLDPTHWQPLPGPPVSP